MKLLLMVIFVTSCWLKIRADSGSGSANENTKIQTIESEICFELNQKSATLICRACNETGGPIIRWCIIRKAKVFPDVCSLNSSDFVNAEYEDVKIKPDGNVLLDPVRNGYGSVLFKCTRLCDNGQSEEHIISVSVESSFKNKLLGEKLHDATWYKHERGRFLCMSGRSYGEIVTSWKLNGSKLNFTNLELPEASDCDLKAGCKQACLKNTVSQLVPTYSQELYHIMMKHSACSSDADYFDYENEYFNYISLLMFSEVSTANAGTYMFTITGNDGQLTSLKEGIEATIEVIDASIDSNIEIIAGNLTNPRTFLLTQYRLHLIQCRAIHLNLSTFPQWFKDNKPIERLHAAVSIGCGGTMGTQMYYVVHTNRTSTIDYPGDSHLTVYSSVAKLYLCEVTQAVAGNYSCSIATDDNIIDHKTLQVTVQLPASSSSDADDNTQRLLIIWFTVLNGVLVVAILITLVVWCKMRSSVNKQKQVHSMNDISLPVYLHDYPLEQETEFTQDGVDLLEFPFNQLEFLHLLGEGNFGCVRKARANGIIPDDHVRNIVAVKTLKNNARPMDIDDLRQELYILKKIQPHCNILNLLGYCTKPETPLCLIIEFAAQGSLKQFLTLCKQNMEKTNTPPTPMVTNKCTGKGYYNESKVMQPTTQSVTQPVTQSAIQPVTLSTTQPVTQSMTQPVTQPMTRPVTQYINTDGNWYMYREDSTEHSTAGNYYNSGKCLLQKDYSNSPGRLGVMDIYCFLLQIAKGMEHIGKMKLIHRDLAARNVLIAEGFVLKIGDFGLSRNLTDKDYYRKTGRGMIPVRWMAIESLETGLHTYQSDVWSFGVVAWEILTYAEMPYGNEAFARSIKGMVDHLKCGHRLLCPSVPHAANFYSMMTDCWAANSDERPSFSELAVMFESQLSALLAQAST